MDMLSLFTPVLAIAFLIERILEAGFDVVEMSTNLKANPERYVPMKKIASLVVGVILGVIIAGVLGVALFSQLGLTGIEASTDRLITGAIAGALAPYAHQVFELLLNIQKFFSARKEEIKATTPSSS